MAQAQFGAQPCPHQGLSGPAVPLVMAYCTQLPQLLRTARPQQLYTTTLQAAELLCRPGVTLTQQMGLSTFRLDRPLSPRGLWCKVRPNGPGPGWSCHHLGFCQLRLDRNFQEQSTLWRL